MKPTLTYCTNVHPGETIAEVEASLERWTVPLKRELAPQPFAADRPFPVGLYLSAASARELSRRDRLERFREFLSQRRLEVATLNCFPYGGFHAESVKLEVYRPDWCDPRRVDFTVAAARALAELAPPGAVAPISTLGGSCKRFGDGGEVRPAVAENLARVAVELDRLRAESGREIVLSLEPEPFSTIETSDETVRFFVDHLFAAGGRAAFAAGGGDPRRAEECLRRHVGICFDACHQAVEFEEPAEAVERVGAAGIRIGKVQLSSALALSRPSDPAQIEALARYAEPRYLHQAFARGRDGAISRWLDLPDLLAQPPGLRSTFEEIRVHFHVPIDRTELSPLTTTRPFLTEVVAAVQRGATVPVLEVETYTFPVLPDAPGPDGGLVAALAREIRFAAGLTA